MFVTPAEAGVQGAGQDKMDSAPRHGASFRGNDGVGFFALIAITACLI